MLKPSNCQQHSSDTAFNKFYKCNLLTQNKFHILGIENILNVNLNLYTYIILKFRNKTTKHFIRKKKNGSWSNTTD